jgi:hypothetical protein
VCARLERRIVELYAEMRQLTSNGKSREMSLEQQHKREMKELEERLKQKYEQEKKDALEKQRMEFLQELKVVDYSPCEHLRHSAPFYFYAYHHMSICVNNSR